MKEVIMFNKITKEEKEEKFKIVKEKVNENVTEIRFIPNIPNKEYWRLIKKN